MYSVQDVINWFLSRGPMSPKKLQKLLYYAYVWTLVLENDNSEELNNKLFDAEFEAWVHGPVIPEVYQDFKNFGYKDIPQSNQNVTFSEDIEDILNQVWHEYGHYSGNELESITHQETPWRNARHGYSPIERCNEVISDEAIFNYYIRFVEIED